MRRAGAWLLAFLSACSVALPCQASDWRSIHEKADTLSLAEAEALAAKDPSSPGSLYLLGLVYLNFHKDKEAEDVFQKVVAADRESSGGRWGLAEALRRRHELDTAEKKLEEIIKADPSYAPAFISLGYVCYEKKEYDRAIATAQKVLRMGQDRVDVTNYARAYLIIGGAKGMIANGGGPLSKLINGLHALPYLKKAEALRPDFVGTLFGLGSFYILAPSMAGGDKEKGFEYLGKAARADALFPDTYARMAQGYKMTGDIAKAKEYLKKAQDIDPRNTLVLTVQKTLE